MTITLPTDFAKDLTATCARVADSGSPPFASIHIATAGDQVTFTAGDRDIFVSKWTMGGTSTEDRALLVPARMLADVIGRCPGESVTLAPADGHLAVTSGRWRVKLPIGDPAEFDPWLLRDEGANVIFDGGEQSDQLVTALRQVAVAASPDGSRPMLTAVHFDLGDDGLRLVATDSYRLATRLLDHGDVDRIDSGPANIPADAIDRVIAARESSDKLTAFIDDDHAQFHVGRTTIRTTLIPGNYPQWQALIAAKEPAGWLTIDDPAAMAAVVKRCHPFGGDMRLVTLTLDADQAEIRAVTADVGEATEDVPVNWTGPAGFAITFNGRFLAEAINTFDGAPVTLAPIDDVKPVLIRPAGDTTGPNLSLLMPVRRH